MCQGDASSALSFNTFSAGRNEVGIMQNSVNLFTGEVDLPVSIASLPSVRGLTAGVAASYSSANSSYLRETWNLEAPTGMLGMGWNMDFPKVVVDNKQTGTREDDEFYLVEGGSSSKLIRTGGNSTERVYETLNYQFWKIKYYVVSEKWEIIKEDGSKYVYGDLNSTRNTVQFIVKWGNWIGSSSQLSGQQQQAAIWNLSEIRNINGDAIKYKYHNVDQFVGSSSGKKYTEATYLTEIVDPLGRKIVFFHLLKSPNEYQDPHTEKSEPDAYQERYEKLYLREVQILDRDGKIIGKVNFDFEIKERETCPSAIYPVLTGSLELV